MSSLSRLLRRAFFWGLGIEVPLAFLLVLMGISRSAPDEPASLNVAEMAHYPGVALLLILGETFGFSPPDDGLGFILPVAAANASILIVIIWSVFILWNKWSGAKRNQGAA